MQRFTDRIILITGAARGIGRAAAEEFAREGGVVIATDIDLDELSAAVRAMTEQGLRVAGLHQDVADEDQWTVIVDGVVAQHGRIDVLVNNAGAGFLKSIEDTSGADWRRLMAINLESVFYGTRAGIAAMKQRGGVIVNVASIAANVAEPMFPAYNATKGGVSMFTKAAAVDCARKRYPIRINSLHPGYADTKLVSDAITALGDDAAAFAEGVAAAIPLGRLATPTEIARPLLFLASDDASYMVGSELIVDGGYIAV
ncbi:glucose 1-dehydrogenase [Sphingomonas sp.]|uniref:glucose 1-dehydrogenase n=1 Tax=Sphingomonas sp. TaxID=28214 RepID=UPI003D6C9E40